MIVDCAPVKTPTFSGLELDCVEKGRVLKKIVSVIDFGVVRRPTQVEVSIFTVKR